MLYILIRTVLIYIILMITMRIMGKRQLGELDIGELVITILLSEIASLPITNPERSFFDALIPIAVLVSLEFLTSTLILKCPLAKKLLSSKPCVIIAHGRLDRKAMNKVRISIEELISQIRQNGIYDLDEVDYAILEENGKMSIIPKNQYRQPDKNDLQISSADSGMMHVLISDGVINKHSLSLLHKDQKWLDKQLKQNKLLPRQVFCMTCNDAGDIYIIKNDGTTVQTGPSHK